ncbi:MAG TPA: Uma2 family endonuclease, partial [Urbifossiella sp.]|nr:Uma2 family endonuclease [Urbifossiella sp.]
MSKQSARKDYDANLRKYERELRVPYYLPFDPDNDELTLFRPAADRYATVGALTTGRQPIPELEREVALQDGWVRYWFRGELLPLPAELADELDDERAARGEAGRERDAARARAVAPEAEVARLREELARARGGGGSLARGGGRSYNLGTLHHPPRSPPCPPTRPSTASSAWASSAAGRGPSSAASTPP